MRKDKLRITYHALLLMKYSLAAAIGKGFAKFATYGKKYGVEWWILIAGAGIILAILFMAVFSGVIAPFEPHDQNAGPQLTPPGGAYLMGTDNLQRDVWSRMVHGSRTILRISVLAAIISFGVGVPLGLVSGFTGGILDKLLSLVMDSMYSFPGLILAIAFAAMLGPGVINITLAVAVIYIPTYFRLVRGQTLTIKQELYVEAAQAIGATKTTTLIQYVFPNTIATIVVVFTLNVADAIMIEAALTYLGLGLPPDVIDWGMDLSMGKKFLPSGQWWMITFPGMMISLLALGFTMLGEGLAEILNPRLLEQ
jgi:peptide/nickel transport system permease protein